MVKTLNATGANTHQNPMLIDSYDIERVKTLNMHIVSMTVSVCVILTSGGKHGEVHRMHCFYTVLPL